MRCLNLFGIGLVSVLVCLGPAVCGNPQRKKYEPEGIAVHTYQDVLKVAVLMKSINLNFGKRSIK